VGIGHWLDVPAGNLRGTPFEMVIGVLGILKAGGAAPLDPTYPKERLKLMIENLCRRWR
jgi:non-ribosomal peptide synthetase component F